MILDNYSSRVRETQTASSSMGFSLYVFDFFQMKDRPAQAEQFAEKVPDAVIPNEVRNLSLI
jgi:hypothetical protein